MAIPTVEGGSGRGLFSTDDGDDDEWALEINAKGLSGSMVNASKDISLDSMSLTSYFAEVNNYMDVVSQFLYTEDVYYYMENFWGWDLSADALVATLTDGSGGFTEMAGVMVSVSTEQASHPRALCVNVCGRPKRMHMAHTCVWRGPRSCA